MTRNSPANAAGVGAKGGDSTRLVLGEFEAHLYCNRQEKPALFYFVVNRAGDPEILHCGHASSLEAAEHEARYFLKLRVEKSRRKTRG